MTDTDMLLRRLLRRIQEHGYYHHTDEILVEWLTGNASIKAICAKYHTITPDALYKQKERLAQQEQ